VNFAKKFKEVVVANFVEISRPEEEQQEETAKEREEQVTAVKPAVRLPEPTSARSADPVATGMPTLQMKTPFEQAAEDAHAKATSPFATPTVADHIPPPFNVSSESDAVVAEPPAFADPHRDAIMAAAQGFADTFATAQASEHAPVNDPLDLVGEDASIDFDRWYAAGNLAPSGAFTAERALEMLLRLPSDMPLRFKRDSVKATLDAMGQVLGATSNDILGDAERKRARLEEYVVAVGARAEELESVENAEIARLKEEIARLNAEIADSEGRIQEVNNRRDQAIAVTRNRVDQFDQVVAFFTVEDAGSASAHEESYDEEDLPAFMREDAVFRMLGIDNGPEPSGNGNGHEESDTADNRNSPAAVVASEGAA